MKKYTLHLLALVYLAVFFLPFASGADALSFTTVTVRGFDFLMGHFQAFGVLLIVLVAYFVLKDRGNVSILLLTLVGLLLLYIYSSPFFVRHLGSTSYLTYLKTLLTGGLKAGFYLSALLALAGYIILWRKRQ